MKTLLIDNYDSYTYNLYQMLSVINGEEPFVLRNDAMEWDELKKYQFDNIVISPGPGNPSRSNDFGVCTHAIQYADVPLLGVCLGHQGIGHLWGSKVTHAPEVMHGRLSNLFHDGSEFFDSIPQGSNVVRYHSLMVAEPLSEDLEKTAWTEDGIIMGLRHKSRPMWGVQFHPESISTEYGYQLLLNFKALTKKFLSNVQNENYKRKDLELISDLNAIPVCLNDKTYAKENGKYKVNVRKLDKFDSPEEVFVSVYANELYSFWLDSSRPDSGNARFSYMGAYGGPYSQRLSYEIQTGLLKVTNSQGTKTIKESVYDYIERMLSIINCKNELPFDFNNGFVGYFGYEMKKESGGSMENESPYPDAAFVLSDRLIVFDHYEKEMYLLSLTPENRTDLGEQWFDQTEMRLKQLKPISNSARLKTISPTEKTNFKWKQSHDEYMESINKVKNYLQDGETYEINLTNEISTEAEVDSLELYLILRRVNPAPYSAYLNYGDYQVLCSSPERFIKVDQVGNVEAKPIKGTTKRGNTILEDEVLREQLQNSEKNRSENLMIVDLLRNDLGLVCEVGSVKVPKLMEIETFETVHQMVSTVTGKLRTVLSAISCIKASFPGGSMTGAPKIRSMAIIDELEARPRGIYSGCIGFLGSNGALDMNIVIRTIVCQNGKLTIGVGGAIIMPSNADEEYDETFLKAHALIKAIVTKVHGKYDPSLYQIIGDRHTLETTASL